MTLWLLVPFLAGLLVGVNPYVAPSLRARLAERGGARVVLLETGAITLGLLALFIALAWRFSAFVSGRLTNSLLLLGLFALAGAFYSLRPLRRREPEPPAVGWRWVTAYAGDSFYYAGPAWILATVFAMRQLTFARFGLAYAAAAAGILLAIAAWSTRLRAALPSGPAARGEPRAPALTALALAYAAAAVLMLAAYLKLL